MTRGRSGPDVAPRAPGVDARDDTRGWRRARGPLACGLLAAAALLVGCPLPQPLPDYPPGTVTPPRILTATATRSAESIITVPARCPGTAPTYALDAHIFYPINVTVVARWFVDYKARMQERSGIRGESQVQADPNPEVLERAVPPFTFTPYGFAIPDELGLAAGTLRDDPGVVHVVELVVSNGFDPDPFAPEPNRTPGFTDGGARFEIQTFRWVFVNVAEPPTCPDPADARCCPP